jgi:hypothetical protein
MIQMIDDATDAVPEIYAVPDASDIHNATDAVPEIYAVPDANDAITTTTLQLTEQQLQQLLQMQQQMMLDLEGQDGEMM